MKRVFVDTGGFVALLVAEDSAHQRAVALFEQATADRWALLTSNTVVVETYSVLLARARDGRRAALAFLDAVAVGRPDARRPTRGRRQFSAAGIVR